MGRIEKTVFISYRRTNFYTALAVYQYLTQYGYDVFFDYQSIDSGDFTKAILENIEARAHFVLILSPSALERCNQPGDWLRREIETAIDLKRNIVPMMMEGFDFGSPSTIQALTGKMAALSSYNGLRLYADYFFDAMEKLRTRFLNVTLDELRTSEISVATKAANIAKKSLADEAEPVEPNQLSAEEWFERAYAFQESKNYKDAIRCYQKALELEPDLDAAHNNLGNIFSDLKRYNEAETAYRKAIELNPDDATAYSNLGNLLSDENLKRYDGAETAYRKAIELNPDYTNAYHNLGVLLKNLKRYAEAETAYRKAIELNPDYATAHYNLGNLLSDENLKRYAEAETAYRKAIELNPDYTNAYHNLGVLLKNLKRYAEAETAYRKAIELNPDYATAHYNLGNLLSDENLKRYAEAETAYRKAIELNPDLAQAYSNLASLKSLTGNFDDAFEYLEKASKLDGFNPAWAWEDPDLQWIREDPRFVEIVGPKPE
ncbi:MAG: tetratricopeptide repeat protein [Anaerolineales bacterium]|nr:MAG: tetratricopeptide repeat protein [Anaerolineales bacterium]